MVRFGSNGSRSISLQIHEEDEEEIDSGVIPDDHSFASADAFVMASTLQQGKARSRLSSRCESTDSSKSGSNNSGSGGGCGELPAGKSNYRILVLGTCGVGKTSIIRQFLYDKFSPAYRATAVEDMYRGEFDIYGQKVGFDIQDVSGNYVYEFPGMRNVSLASADAFIIVFALDDANSWEEVARLRDMVHEAKKSRDGEQVPIVVVGNKCEVEAGHDPCILKDSPEATVVFDWENGYVESSAKERRNINKIFKELLIQAKAKYDFTVPQLATASALVNTLSSPSPHLQTPRRQSSLNEAMTRRQSLPSVPGNAAHMQQLLASVGEQGEVPRSSPARHNPIASMMSKFRSPTTAAAVEADSDSDVFMPSPDAAGKKSSSKRRSSLAALRRDSCRVS